MKNLNNKNKMNDYATLRAFWDSMAIIMLVLGLFALFFVFILSNTASIIVSVVLFVLFLICTQMIGFYDKRLEKKSDLREKE